MSRATVVPSGFNFHPLLLLFMLVPGVVLIPCLPTSNDAQAAAPITSSGLNTQVNLSATPPAGKIQYDITGGTRAGTNLFHSFGYFYVPTNNIANFLNDSGFATSNILGRVTGGNISNIFGTIQTTGFGNANLFLMNPAGFLFGPNATINVGGMMTFTTADYMRLTDGGRFNANPNAMPPDVLTAAPVAAFGFLGANPAAINFVGGQLTVAGGTGLALVGGNISLTPDTSVTPNVSSSITAPGRPILLTSVAGPGEVAADTGIPAAGMALGTVTLGQGTTFSTVGNVSYGDGSGGAVSIRGGQFVATGASILTKPASGSTGQGGSVSIRVTDTASMTGSRSSINTSSLNTSSSSPNRGDAGAVSINGSDVILQNTGINTTYTGNGASTGSGNGGAVTLTGTDRVALTGSGIATGVIFTNGNSSSLGNAGAVTLNGTTSVSLSASTINTSTFNSTGNSGSVTITGGTVTIVQNPAPGSSASINTSTSNSGGPQGNGGDITITGMNVTLTGSGNLHNPMVASVANGEGTTFGRGGNIRISGSENLLLNNGASLVTTSTDLGPAGNIELVGQQVSISEFGLFSNALSTGASGAITITGTGAIAVTKGSVISTVTNSRGPAGPITISTPNLAISGGSQVLSETTGSGRGGFITVQGTNSPAQSVQIDGAGTGIFTDTQGTGAGGNIFVNANSVMLQNGGTLSAKTSGTSPSAIGGFISVNATDGVTMTNGGLITASSTGPGNAGNISINAGQQLEMQNSSVKTEAARAGGGNISIRAVDIMRMGNSTVSTSVLGGGGSGGNITIDPNAVILQNSRILAQAVQGAGGNITITTNLLLPDANSTISASSQFGQNGTITIQSPISPASGKIIPLSQRPLIAVSLLSQRCAALAGGNFSSFTVAGRDSLPAEPGAWLSSPLALTITESGSGTLTEAGTTLSSGELTGETPLLSLRQIAPPGFLTQTFAVESSAGCAS